MVRVLLRQFYLAVTDFRFYLEAFQQTWHRTFGFLIFLAVGVAGVATVLEALWLFPALDAFGAWGKNHLPAFKVVDGRLSLERTGPIFLQYGSNPGWIFFLSDSDVPETELPIGAPAVLLLPEEIVIRYNDTERAHSWVQVGDFTFTPSDFDGYLSYTKWFFVPVVYSFLLVFQVFAKLFTAILLTPVSLWTSVALGVRIPFRWGFNIAAYSLAPAVTIDLGVRMTRVEITYFDWIYLGVAVLYTVMATRRCILPEG